MLPGILLAWALPLSAQPNASVRTSPSSPISLVATGEQFAQQAKAAWETGALTRGLDILDAGLREYPRAVSLHKLRGDLLTTDRQTDGALAAYDAALSIQPTASAVRWAKWSLLVRSGRAEESLDELRKLAEITPDNPLIHLRLAQELRRFDHLEESVGAYEKAVALRPDLLTWRLGLARARYDVLDYAGAYQEVQDVLKQVPPGSPIVIPAKNLLEIIYAPSKERGRRFNPILTPEVTEDRLKEWAAVRAEAWTLYSQGRYEQAVPIYQRILALNPTDSTAAHQLGIALMEIGRCEEAVAVFGKMGQLDATDEAYADTIFRMGQCLVELERWEEAFVQFQTLYDAAMEFEQANKGVTLPPGTRVLDKHKIAKWLETVRPHVPAELMPPKAAPLSPEMTPEELSAKVRDMPFNPQKALDTRASLMGRDADFSWFRFVIPAGKVMRDDSPMGAHEFIPLNPNDTFPSSQQDVYLVFSLVSSSYDEVPLTARCFVETLETSPDQQAAAQDRVIMATNDQSGFFALVRPTTGWTPGLYRCGLYAGEKTSADTHVDEVRFRIVGSPDSAS
ncbi:hypothetical protein YTPLAS18_14600 [Nitrospira sp.]|nr:hypothetical protein YTPLAS18_14600 [Nitrospira sp.]